MSNVAIKRDHTGKMHLWVGGGPVREANVVSITGSGEGKNEMIAVAYIPISKVTFGEEDPDNVITGRFPSLPIPLTTR